VSRPASPTRATAALAAAELRVTARRGENILVTLIIPPAVLLFFATTGLLPARAGRPVDFLLPGSLALAIIAAGLVNLGIATAYERSYGVLKRLGGSPLPRWGLVAAKIAAVLVVEIVQVVVLLVVAIVILGWRPGAGVSAILFVAAILLGTLAFAGLGLLMAGRLRAEATLALANGLFLGFLMIGGIVIPIDHLPAPLAAVAALLPASALAEAFRAALGTGSEAASSLLILAAWGIGAATLAVRTFRWE
jgi:ABC-2 type transport system permease protein